jgi:DAK2 domain fusion protein YloV
VSRPSWDGPDLLAALGHATATLHAHVDEVNALNVFPVPDGDTGSNMLATTQAAREEAETLPVDERSVGRVAAAIALGALMGARGNSGVILSQLFRGMSEALASRERVDGSALAEAFDRGCTLAFAAVAHPVEGTILTVARAVAVRAQAVARTDSSLAAVLGASVAAAETEVARTPQLLPILREAGVVDAGGRGLQLLLRGALGYLLDEPRPAASHEAVALPSFETLADEGFGYETVYVVMPQDGAQLDPTGIRRRLDELGESVLVAGDARAVKIHVHSERPDEVIAYGLSLGVLSRISVENLDRQAHASRQRAAEAVLATSPQALAGAAAAAAANGDGAANGADGATEWVPVTAEPARLNNGLAVIAVAQGHGLARLFTELGVTVVEGGQRANPSAGELVAAIRATGSGEVIVLPNNPNVRMAALQAGELLPDVRVRVVPTRNAAEGVAALLALDPGVDGPANVGRMSHAAAGIQTLLMTTAVRDARIGRRRVRRGQHIVLDPDDGLVAAAADQAAALGGAIRKLQPGFELLTFYFGADVERAEAERVAEALRAQLDGVDIELVEGGQPHYSFLVAAE